MPTTEDGYSWGCRGQKPRHGFKLSLNACRYMGASEQRDIEFDPIEYGLAGPVRTLDDMSEEEKRNLCRQYGCEIAGES